CLRVRMALHQPPSAKINVNVQPPLLQSTCTSVCVCVCLFVPLSNLWVRLCLCFCFCVGVSVCLISIYVSLSVDVVCVCVCYMCVYISNEASPGFELRVELYSCCSEDDCSAGSTPRKLASKLS